MSESKDLVVAGSNFAVVNFDTADLKEIIADNLGANGGLTMYDLDRVKIPAGGATTWEIPTAAGPVESKTLSGIIVSWRETRAYWSVPIEQSGSNATPDCSSDDAVLGFGAPGGDCSKCPLAQFGSGKNGEGQACKLVRHLFMIRENGILPLVVDVAPGSNKPLRQYFMRLASEGIPYHQVVTTLTLEKAQNAQNITYAKIVAANAGRLEGDHAAAVKQYRNFLLPALETLKIDQQQD